MEKSKSTREREKQAGPPEQGLLLKSLSFVLVTSGETTKSDQARLFLKKLFINKKKKKKQ